MTVVTVSWERIQRSAASGNGMPSGTARVSVASTMAAIGGIILVTVDSLSRRQQTATGRA